MEISDWISAGSVVVAAIALFLAGNANRHAKRAAISAEKANGIAEDGLGQAQEANEISKLANKLSEETQTITQREFEMKHEQFVINFAIQWNKESLSLVITNNGTHPAFNVMISVAYPGFVKTDGPHAEVEPGGGEISVLLSEISDEREKHNASSRSKFGYSTLFQRTAKVVLSYQTKLGNTVETEPAPVIIR